MIAHEPLERLTMNPAIRDFLEGVTAAVVGLIGTALFTMAPAAITSWGSAAIAAVALAALYVLRSRLAVLYVMAGSAVAGVLVEWGW
jgi:chromate transporter